ncbi:MAG: cupin domain-containing protein, partial [Myxococcota bacterium]
KIITKKGIAKVKAKARGCSGRFRMTMNGASVVLGAGDCLAVPRGTVHSAEVVGDEPVVSLDAIRE